MLSWFKVQLITAVALSGSFYLHAVENCFMINRCLGRRTCDRSTFVRVPFCRGGGLRFTWRGLIISDGCAARKTERSAVVVLALLHPELEWRLYTRILVPFPELFLTSRNPFTNGLFSNLSNYSWTMSQSPISIGFRFSYSRENQKWSNTINRWINKSAQRIYQSMNQCVS